MIPAINIRKVFQLFRGKLFFTSEESVADRFGGEVFNTTRNLTLVGRKNGTKTNLILVSPQEIGLKVVIEKELGRIVHGQQYTRKNQKMLLEQDCLRNLVLIILKGKKKGDLFFKKNEK
jgi:hypothetical protein